MLNSAPKRLILPFCPSESRESEVEAAAVFAYADINRSNGKGLFIKQPEETLVFIAKVGYPIWVFPKNNNALIFDGLSNSSYEVPYDEVTSTLAFIENFQANSMPRENYIAFLSANRSYFSIFPKERQFSIKGIIADGNFKGEFSVYCKEANEITQATPLLTPMLEESTISANLNEMDKLQTYFREEYDRLREILSLISKITSQHIADIEYEAEAAREEVNAKIKAQEEFINPKISKVVKKYKKIIKELNSNYSHELENLQKQKDKTRMQIEKTQAEIQRYKQEAKEQGKNENKTNEKRWKAKANKTQKELSGLKKAQKNIEDNIKRLIKQKDQDLSKLDLELDAETKLLRKPIEDLEQTRNAKDAAYKAESNQLIGLEKLLVEDINFNLSHRESMSANFNNLGVNDPQLRSVTLVYVPFYLICYESGLSKRYLCIPPSSVHGLDLSVKFKGVLGICKIKDLLTPRFKTVQAIISQVETLAKMNSLFESQLWNIGVKNNLLKNSTFHTEAKSGLAFLKAEGWLSEREEAELCDKLIT
jgi:hypothetical protein